MKKGKNLKNIAFVVAMAVLLNFKASALELENTESIGVTQANIVDGENIINEAQNMEEITTSVIGLSTEEITEKLPSNEVNNWESYSSEEVTEEKGIDVDGNLNQIVELLDGNNTSPKKDELYCSYINLNEKKKIYLEKYMAYLQLQYSAGETMEQMGMVISTDLKEVNVALEMAKAELLVAENDLAYYTICLTENGIKIDDYNIEALKTIYEEEYYKENYPEKDYLEMLQYRNEYVNQTILLEAKKKEEELISEKIATNELLYSNGEISKIELEAAKLEKYKFDYEIAQYYVNLSQVYYNLEYVLEN